MNSGKGILQLIVSMADSALKLESLRKRLKKKDNIDKDKYSLVAGYIREFEIENKFIIIPNEILIVILLFYLEQYEILSFAHNYKSSKIILTDNGKCAGKMSEFGNYHVLGDHEAVKQGICVWRVKVECIFYIHIS